MKKILFAAALALLTIGSHAAAVYTQPPAAGATSYLSSTDINGGSNLEQFIWDTFSVATNVTLREFQWRGTRAGTTPAGFQITISTAIQSGGTVWNITGNANETPTATPGVYDYRFTLPAGFVLTGGQGYWFQIVGLVTNFFPYGGNAWQWSAGTGGNGVHLAQVPAITGDFRMAAVAGDVAFTLLDAATVPVTIAVQALPSAAGTATGGGTFNPGTNVTVIATPATGHAFINWTENGNVVSTSTNFTFAADGNKTLNANFSGPNTGPYVITAVAVPSLCGTVGGTGTFKAGDSVSIDVSPADGYTFVNWTENGIAVSTSLTYDFTATAPRNLQANFTIPGLNMAVVGTPSPTYGGTVAAVGSPGTSANTFLGGTTVILTATPAPGYHFVNWIQAADTGGPQRVVGTGSPIFTNVVAFGMFLTANFAADFPALTLGVLPAASGTVTGAGAYANGSTVTANATPAVGYAFVNWQQGTTVLSTNAGYTLTLTNPVALTANFVAKTNTITATVAPLAGGNVTGAGTYGNGASVILTAIPATGYVFTNWTLGGAAAGTNNPVTFNALGNYAFVANFAVAPLPVAPPPLALLQSSPGALILQWPTNASGFLLEQNSDLASTNWVTFAGPTPVVGTNYQATIPTQTGSGFFRLHHP
jgi:hypothetical protein